ncbi:hypothetical protein IMPR6_50095 [Imperialibacter sp. EC-SDR9]|nr:hypothetical protein IMPERIA89_50193 [Imperialibacter sp. 89]CAD5286519.1 hypothetical protein IMPERIA75_600095 [Imperialibacter sp. 75]VVT30035.1 hypothetical protein IMPR6_50095 [Imperialibacter sp. EC-SDR9]
MGIQKRKTVKSISKTQNKEEDEKVNFNNRSNDYDGGYQLLWGWQGYHAQPKPKLHSGAPEGE